MPGQYAAYHAQQRRQGQVGLNDQPGLVHIAVAHRGQVVKRYIARPGGVQGILGLAQLFVLHLQFDLVHMQFMEQQLGLLRCHGAHRLQRQINVAVQLSFRLRAQCMQARLGGRVFW